MYEFKNTSILHEDMMNVKDRVGKNWMKINCGLSIDVLQKSELSRNAGSIFYVSHPTECV